MQSNVLLLKALHTQTLMLQSFFVWYYQYRLMPHVS